jgi:xanthine dehydrogenase YagR molybdenum-binding subunit
MGSKGIGEIGIVGTAAAVANAVCHATGCRVRDLPITPARFLAERRAGLPLYPAHPGSPGPAVA